MLEILRPGEINILKIEVTREKIKIPSVDSKILEDEKT
jgi:C-terminal processing protease CtpA/Prc